MAWCFIHGYWPEDHIDHINGDRSDNRLINLRKATASENAQNKKNAAIKNKSKFLGVTKVTKTKRTKPYQAQIAINGKYKFLGMFSTAELAHEAYILKKRELHPFSTI